MESQIKLKEINPMASNNETFSAGLLSTTTTIMLNLCNSDNFCMIPPHEQISANSLELNAITSLSDDSGVPLTNSSISSGDSSYKMEICKFEMELVESDGEVSQFDSLDNCSEGGMSAENFNTLKKGPIAPIDPPPEFQDSPHTTLIRSQALQDYTRSLSKNGLSTRWSSQASLQTKDSGKLEQYAVEYETTRGSYNTSLKDSYNKHIYSSDSILNNIIDNIYDEPNEIISSSLGNSIDIVEPKPTKPTCPHFQDHTRYFKAIQSEQDNSTITTNTTTTHHHNHQKFNLSALSEIHDYDLYYGLKRNHYQCDTIQRKLLYSPMHHHHHHSTNSGNRPNSRNSLNSRLSSSHNSLSVSNANKADDSIFITQAMSHDALLSREICDFYNVPIDSDIYAFPIDMIKPCTKDTYKKDNMKHQKARLKYGRNNKRRKRNNNNNTDENNSGIDKFANKTKIYKSDDKRSTVSDSPIEPLHMTLDEVKQFYHTLYSDTKELPLRNNLLNHSNNKTSSKNMLHNNGMMKSNTETIGGLITPRSTKPASIKTFTIKSNAANATTMALKNSTGKITEKSDISNNNNNNNSNINNNKLTVHSEKKSQFSLNLKQKFCSIFRFRNKNQNNRCRTNSTDSTAEYIAANRESLTTNYQANNADDKRKKFQSRALPPLPNKNIAAEPKESPPPPPPLLPPDEEIEDTEKEKPEFRSFHFTSSIEKVKDYGWYWGPLSSEAAEKVLSNEPDGSFIVRDSSDDHYIFSLSFKLNNCVRHVRIEQDQGTFSFGTYAKFKSQTITEFIEKAVEHSRSGRYLFFLHRRPEHGPMRVQLTNPVSRFKHIQSLQHMCRFVILKAVVRKDLIETLPLPRRLLDYLNYKHFYSEQVESDSSQSQMSGDGQV